MSGYLQGNELAASQKPAANAPAAASAKAEVPKPFTKPVTIHTLAELRARGEKIAMLTCYDASFAALMDRCGVEMLLIGDSLGMVCNGHPSTLPVTVAELAYHTASVARGSKTAMVVADLSFGSYGTPETAYHNAVQLM
ncbi:MAG: 3-methyl-2-oxobutanoate hydroxymethyltransferase, partial [Duganella sp.]